ncbi:hypothetical protein TpMuguga_02g00939 [Theileria parva strain Muguga]|uniref:SfiI-subtelomeric related protein family member n=1 Tax=Theileria parva TaxID=5875 RepID=Q4N3P9_THEPA|nr:uncharacterized protein TpMuguga_02g00939 [Theileria parva strain Muguga]EAN33224.1 hypothetical protein TpMuguga_02g00939 [Theileria parva strain Muguga]|eukprot:XP_765507.1 hypothetical protein [Theileria parva strain Muguga]
MNYVLKLLFLAGLYIFVYINASEDIETLVSTHGDSESPTHYSEITLDASCGSSNEYLVVEDKKYGGQNFRTYTTTHSNIITTVNYKKFVVWKAEDGEHSKFVRIRKKSGKDRILVIETVRNGSNTTKTFTKTRGIYHELGTVALNINDKNKPDYTFTSTVKDNNGENTYTPKDNKKIGLVFLKSCCSSAQLFWKATGNWYCTKVTTTIQSGNLVKITLDTTDGSNTSEVVLIDQGGGIWVPDKTVYLDVKTKEDAPNCNYTSSITNNNGTYTYEPEEGFSIIKVSHGSGSDDLIWESSSDLFCIKVTGTVESDKTTKLNLVLKNSSNKEISKVFYPYGSSWIEGNAENNKDL